MHCVPVTHKTQFEIFWFLCCFNFIICWTMLSVYNVWGVEKIYNECKFDKMNDIWQILQCECALLCIYHNSQGNNGCNLIFLFIAWNLDFYQLAAHNFNDNCLSIHCSIKHHIVLFGRRCMFKRDFKLCQALFDTRYVLIFLSINLCGLQLKIEREKDLYDNMRSS